VIHAAPRSPPSIRARRAPVMALLVTLVVLAPAAARAQTPSAPNVRPTASFGVAFALVGLDTYGIAGDVHVGADLAFGDRSNELALGPGWPPYPMTGSRLDLFVLYSGGRFRPAPEVGFFTLVTLGVSLGREALDVSIGQQRIRDVLLEPGAMVSVVVGWTLFDYVDVALGWRQSILATDRLETLGSFVANVGGRL